MGLDNLFSANGFIEKKERKEWKNGDTAYSVGSIEPICGYIAESVT